MAVEAITTWHARVYGSQDEICRGFVVCDVGDWAEL